MARLLRGPMTAGKALLVMVLTAVIGLACYSVLVIGLAFYSSYSASMTQAKEAALKQDRLLITEAVEMYRTDHQRYPSSLEELVNARYIRSIPIDPFTNAPLTWERPKVPRVEPASRAGPGGRER